MFTSALLPDYSLRRKFPRYFYTEPAAAANGLDVHGDGPGIFVRGDNLSLAVVGIPAPKYALGNKESDETIANRNYLLSNEVSK